MAPGSRDPRGTRRQPAPARRPARGAARTPVGRVAPSRGPARHGRPTGRQAPARPRTTTQPKRRPALPLPPIRARLLGIVLVTVLAFSAIGVRLFDLQARDRSHLSSLGVGQRVRTVSIPAERGNIFDRTGTILAASVPQTTVVADPRVIKDPVAYAAKLAPIVQVDQAELATRLSDHDSAFAYVARKVNDQVAKQVRDLDLVGISFQDESKRYYPLGTIAAPVVGFTGTDNTGLEGMEYHYDSLLTGKPGSAQVERDPQGNDIPGGERQVKPARRGQDVVLTIDSSLQWRTEQALLQGVTAMNAQRGMAIVVDVQTGDVLSMATVDGATDAEPAHAALATDPNRPVSDVYEPGSTNKVITMAGAIQEGITTPDSISTVADSIVVGDKPFDDDEEHATEELTTAQILAMSSNVGTIQIAQQLGKDRLADYLRAFGFGQRTGLDLPSEAPGITFDAANYNDTSMGAVPIGYGIAVTAMQMLDVYTTIANHGMARPPRLVAATIDAEGKRHVEPLAKPRPVVTPETAQAVNGMLQQVVNEGTGRKAQIDGYQVAGKTGTAEKAPYVGEYNASFAGFAPAGDPRLAAIVVMDAPKGSIYGADAAAPVFKEIMQFALTYERVPTS